MEVCKAGHVWEKAAGKKLPAKEKKACMNRPFVNCKAPLHKCRKKVIEENPVFPRG